MAQCPGKRSWPELVGETGETAARRIERENHHVRAIVLPEGSPTTKDWRCDRVWVWINQHGIVTKVPRVG